MYLISKAMYQLYSQHTLRYDRPMRQIGNRQIFHQNHMREMTVEISHIFHTNEIVAYRSIGLPVALLSIPHAFSIVL